MNVPFTFCNKQPKHRIPCVFAQFLQSLLMPYSRRGKPRYITINTRRFQKGEWESLWTQTLRHNNRNVAHRSQKLNSKPSAPAPIRAYARYAECCARKGALSKANQAMTWDLTPSAAPTRGRGGEGVCCDIRPENAVGEWSRRRKGE